MFFGGGHSEDCIGSNQVASGCYSPQEQKRDEACIKSVRGCGSWSRICRSRSSKDRNRRSSQKRGGRPLRRLHWLASDGLFLLSSIKEETLTQDPYCRPLRQDASLERGRQQWSQVAVDQQLPPKLKDQDYWSRPWVYVDCPVEEWQMFVKARDEIYDLRMQTLLETNK